MNSPLLLALALGLRHGTDPDHLTAIDGLSRIRPRATNGLFFALGHGAVVTLLAVGVGAVLANRVGFLGPWVLILIGLVNLWRVSRPSPPAAFAPRPLAVQPFLLGMLLAAGFETASQFAALILTNRLNPWFVGAAFTFGMVIVDGVDGYLAAATQRMAGLGSGRAATASRWLGVIVVLFSFGLGGAELLNVDIDRFALPTGMTLFLAVIMIRIWVRSNTVLSIGSVKPLVARVLSRPFGGFISAALCVMALSGCQSSASAPVTASHSISVSSKMNTNSEFAQSMTQSMDTMDKQMMAAPMNGDPDHDFAVMMIPHHQGAIDMAEPMMLHGKDPVLRRLAQEILVTQSQEIEVMRDRLAVMQRGIHGAHRDADHGSTQPAAVSSHDRVYTADQTSNTVSVIDAGTNKLLGIIRLGDPVPGALSPLYRGQLLVHGIGFSPDHRTLAVVSVGSNSVTLIDTATNAVKGIVYIGRSPHEAFFTPDGKEVWATVRGEDYISIIDPIRMKEMRRVQTANGPGMVLFHPDGNFAFVPSSFTPELDVVDTKKYEVIARVPQASPFSPNLAVSLDGKEVWFTLKDSGRTQVMSGIPPFHIVATINTGPLTNHVTLIDNANGKFAYVSVGEENTVKIFRRGEKPKLVDTIRTGDLPHGLWGSADGSRVYVGLENQDAVSAIDTLTNKVIATIPVGQQPQALVYVPNAVPEGDGLLNLLPIGNAGEASHIELVAAVGSGPKGHATVSVNALGPLDLLQAAVSGLKPSHGYTLWVVDSRTAPFEQKELLATFRTNIAGAQISQAIAPLRKVLIANGGDGGGQDRQRFLIVTDQDSHAIVLNQTNRVP